MKFAKKYAFCAKISTRSFLSFSSCFRISLKVVWINLHLILLTLQFISFNIQFSCTCRHNFCTLSLTCHLFFDNSAAVASELFYEWIENTICEFLLNENRICRVNLARRKKKQLFKSKMLQWMSYILIAAARRVQI